MPDRSLTPLNPLVHKLQGKPLKQWWQVAEAFKIRGKRATPLDDRYQNPAIRANFSFLFCLPFGMAFMTYVAGPQQSLKILIPAAIVWLIMVAMFLSSFKRHCKIILEVQESDDGLFLSSLMIKRKIRFSEIRDLYALENGDCVLETINGDEYILSSDLTDSEALFKRIRVQAPKPTEVYTNNYRLTESLIDGGIMAALAIVIAVVFPLFTHPPAQVNSLVANCLVALVTVLLAVAFWKFKTSKFAYAVRIGPNSCFLRTRKGTRTLTWDQITDAKRFYLWHALKTRDGWFFLLADKEGPVTSRLLECKKNAVIMR